MDATSSSQGFTELRVEATAESEKVFHRLIQGRLSDEIGINIPPWFRNFTECGSDSGASMWCMNCGEDHPLICKCSLKWCPLCNYRITLKRKEKMQVWSSRIQNPMHLVLTQRNFKDLTREKIREHYSNLTKIRRHKLMKHVKGGCTSVECTNKGEGWHLHSHWLIDCQFVPIEELSKAWGRLTGQEFAIVHFDKINGKDYVKEVCKYVVKSSEMVKWTGKDMLNFILSIRRSRFFFTFGSLRKEAASIKAILREMQIIKEGKKCDNCEEETLIYVPDRTMSSERKMKFS